MTERLDILLLCDYNERTAGTIVDHIKSFPRYSRHRFWVVSNRGNLPFGLELDRFDGIVLHYSLVISYDSFLSRQARSAIRRFRGFKAVYVQDDYRWINRTVAAMQYLRIHALFGLAPRDVMDQVYSPRLLPGVERVTVLAGYVPEDLIGLPPKPFAERRIDVGYRARKLPAWIGTHAQEKWLIADRFLRDAPKHDLVCDISYREEDRIYGNAWISFLRDCKAVLGTESGSSVCDFTGEIQANVEAHERRKPAASFETLRELYFKDVDGTVMMNIISPRCFEAAALRTLMILYEGRYSDAMVPWRHYVPLRKDHSNMDEVVGVLRDPARWQDIVDRAYEEVALNSRYTFREMVRQFDDVVDRCAATLPRRLKTLYTEATFSTAILGVRGMVNRHSGAVSTVGRRLHQFLEYSLAAKLSRFVRLFAGPHTRAVLKRAYFNALEGLISSGNLLGQNLLLLNGLRMTLREPMVWLLLRLPISVGKKLLLLRELAALRQIESRALDDETFGLAICFDDAKRALLIQGLVTEAAALSQEPDLEWDRVIASARSHSALTVRWRMLDQWQLAPHPDLPDEYDFPALSTSFAVAPELAASILRKCLPRIAPVSAHHSPVSASAAH